MPRVLSLHQLSAQAIIRDLCSKAEIGTHQYFDMLPLPVSINAKLTLRAPMEIIVSLYYQPTQLPFSSYNKSPTQETIILI